MTEALIQLGMYGYVVRMLVEAVKAWWNPTDPRRLKTVVFAISLILVWGFGVNPVEMLKLTSVTPALVDPIGAALLAGSAMGTHDLLDFLKNAGGVKPR